MFHLVISGMPIEKISIVQELIDVIGIDAAKRLCLVFGGTRLYIGKSGRAKRRLCVVIGDEMAEKLMSRYKCARMDIPQMKSLERVLRNPEIIADAASGMSQRELSIKYELSERHIRNILPSVLPGSDE